MNRLASAAGTGFTLIPALLLSFATVRDCASRFAWHWWLRLAGGVMIVIWGVLRIAFLVVYEDPMQAYTSRLWIFPVVSTGWTLFGVGYLAMVLVRGEPDAPSSEEIAAPATAAGRPLGAGTLIAALGSVVGGVALLEMLQFAWLDRSLMPDSITLGFPVFMAVCGFPVAAYLAWRLPWDLSWRIVMMVVALLFCLSLVGLFGPFWLMTHMAP